jgi:hypothetical protein
MAVCALLICSPHGLASEPPVDETAPAELLPGDSPRCVPAGAFEVVRRFDFDERPLGNYEETPLNWVRLDGDGLPRYCTARLDDGDGRLAPPSFRFDLQGGSIAYQYVGDDLPLTPGAEHLVVAYARAVGLRQARAFLQIALLDQAGKPIPGSDRISNLVASTTSPTDYDPAHVSGSTQSAEPWQRIEVAVPARFPDAASVRLTLWVLQAYAWRESAEVDPIVRQDIGAQVWFDDVTLYRFPHVALRLSTSAAIVRTGTPASFVIEVHNPTAAALHFELSITDASGQIIHTVRGTVPDRAGPPLESPVPPLEPGTYTAQLRLCNEAESFGNSSLRFAIINELPAAASSSTDFGIDLGQLQDGDSNGLVALVRELGCGAVKLGLPLPDDGRADADVESARDLVHKLLAGGIDPAGVILPPQSANSRMGNTAQSALMTPKRTALLAPLLFPLGNAVTFWQIGDERTELAAGSTWDAAALNDLRRDIRRLVAAPQLVLPQSLFNTGDDAAGQAAGAPHLRNTSDVVSVYIAAHAPTRALPAQLAQLNSTNAIWLMLQTDRALPVEARIAELARRLTLAKAAGAERIFLPAPLACDADTACWYPTEGYVALRTLFRFLAGKHAAAVVPTADKDALAVLFAGDDNSACVVAWSWRDPPGPPLALCGGQQAEVWDVWGRRQTCATGERVAVPLGATPVIVAQVDAAAAALQASLAIDPDFIAADDRDARPVLKLSNPFADEMAGTIRLRVPPYWRASHSEMSFQLSSGQTLEQPLDLEIPPRETAGEKLLGIELEVSAPLLKRLSLSLPLRLGLSNVSFDAAAWWEGNDLIVEQVVRNCGSTPLDLECSCQAPGRPQLDGAILGIAPGSSQSQSFAIPDARDLAGSSLLVGLKEPGGRRLESVIAIPP